MPLVIVVFIILSLPSSVCAEAVDRIVAVINDSIITMSELNAAAALYAEKKGADAKKGEDLRKTVLDGLIEQKLVKQASDRAGIDVSEKEIDNAVDEVKRQNRLTKESLLLALAQSGLTYREYREQLREQIRQVKFMNKEFHSKISIQDEEIEDYYRGNPGEFQGDPSYRIRMILLSGADKDTVNKRLKAVEEGIKNGEPFMGLASQFSDDPSAPSGGDMGYVKAGEMDSSIEEAFMRLKPGGISAPIERPEGVYLIELVDVKKTEVRPLGEVKAMIRERLFKKALDERFAFWLEEVKKTAHVEIRF